MCFLMIQLKNIIPESNDRMPRWDYWAGVTPLWTNAHLDVKDGFSRSGSTVINNFQSGGSALLAIYN
jgi:hypothetical protein